jgi:hypothetical protein
VSKLWLAELDQGAHYGNQRMEKPVANVPRENSDPREDLSFANVPAILWECALDAFIKSILATVFGGIAISLAGIVWHKMAPSAPPGFSPKPEAEARSPGTWSNWEATFKRNQFVIVFVVIFGLTLWGRLGSSHQITCPSRLHKIGKQVSEQWFRLIVINAFGAMISAVVVVWAGQFTLTKLLFGWLVHSVVVGVENVVHQLFGARGGDTALAWFNWYGENQLKFTFWFFYLAAICDDLGFPNLKTLGRWLAGRLRGNAVS